MRKWLKTFVVSLLTLTTLAGCKGGDNSSVNSNPDSSVTSEMEQGWYKVNFELCTTLKTNKVPEQEVEEGDVVVKPSVGVIGDNPDRIR